MRQGAFSGSSRRSKRRRFQQISKFGKFGSAGCGTNRAHSRGDSSSTPTATARTRGVLFICAKRQPATPIGYLRLAPSSGDLSLKTRSVPDYGQFTSSIDQGEGTFAG